MRVRVICHPPPPPLPKSRPIPPLFWSFNTSLSREKHSRARRKREKESTTWGRAWQSNACKKALRSRFGLQSVFTHVTSRFQICCNKRKRLRHKKRVHLPQDTNMATVFMFANISNMADLTSCGLDLRFLFLSLFLASTRAYLT